MTQLSFSILNDLDTSRLLFLDTSDYGSLPTNPTVNIKFPDFEKRIYSSKIQFGEINVLNTVKLGYTDCITEFPDGIYEIEFELPTANCKISQTIFRTTKAWKLLDEVLQTADYFNNKDLLEKFNKINLYLHGAESVVKVNKYQSQQLYKEANVLLKCFDTNVRMFQKYGCT